jgi:hypothetical protein
MCRLRLANTTGSFHHHCNLTRLEWFSPVLNHSFPSASTANFLQNPTGSIFESSHLICPTKQGQTSCFSDTEFFSDELAPNCTEPLASELGHWNTIATEDFWPSCPMTEAFDGGIVDAGPRVSWQSLGSNDFQTNLALQIHAKGIVDLSTQVHGSCYDDLSPSCQACGLAFLTKAAVNQHAKQTQHSPYRCHCGKTFSRIDVLSRHVQTFQSSSRFPCPHCEKFAGIKGFARRDHLIQHLRVYHRIQVHLEGTVKSPTEYTVRRMHLSCPHQDCLSHPDTTLPGSQIFESQSELTKHMRAVHNECLFPCTETGCSRVGGKGFFRKRDLLEHQRTHHFSHSSP